LVSRANPPQLAATYGDRWPGAQQQDRQQSAPPCQQGTSQDRQQAASFQQEKAYALEAWHSSSARDPQTSEVDRASNPKVAFPASGSHLSPFALRTLSLIMRA
jgi:hypothetical protein